MATTSAQVQQLYVGLLGRAADKAGLDYWLNQLNATPATLTLENLRANIVNSQPEYKATFGSLSRVDTVTKIYNNLFGRAPDAAGLTYWSTGAGATVNADQLTLAFITGASTADVQALTNKAIVADVYTSTAGANFVAADATKIVASVNSTPASVGTALGQLSDGSLSGIAIPAAVAQLKAVDTATAAVTAYQTAKVTDLTKINADLVALAKTVDATDASVAVVATSATATAAANFAAQTSNTTGIAQEIADARALIGNGTAGNHVATSTAQLQVNSDVAAKTLADATSALKLAGNGYLTVITNYQAAVTAAATVKDVTAPAVAVAKGTVVNLTANATAAQKTALIKALNDTGLFTTPLTATAFDDATAAATSVDTIYGVVTSAGVTVNAGAAVEAALTAYGYSSLKPVVTQHNDYTTKQAAVVAADTALKAAGTANTEEGNYIAAVAPATVAAKALADSKAVDAIEVQYKAVIDGNAALTGALTTATNAVPTNVIDVKLTATTASYDADALGAVNDVFFFGTDGTATGVTGAKDAIIIGAGSAGTVKGIDSIYVGTDYVKGAGTATATNTITGGNDAAKEVFFFQKGNDTYVVVEAKTFGSSTVTDYTLVGAANVGSPDAAVIKLTGVGIEKVSFANGVVSVA